MLSRWIELAPMLFATAKAEAINIAKHFMTHSSFPAQLAHRYGARSQS
jgi:hypothetical protein